MNKGVRNKQYPGIAGIFGLTRCGQIRSRWLADKRTRDEQADTKGREVY